MSERIPPKPTESRPQLTLHDTAEAIRILQKYSDRMPEGVSEELQRRVATGYIAQRLESIVERHTPQINQDLFDPELVSGK
jgi:hypothetical protein